jgi:hypothetical protein
MIYFKTRSGTRILYSMYSELDEAYEPTEIEYDIISDNFVTYENNENVFLVGVTSDDRVIFSYIEKEKYKTIIDFFDIEMCPNTVLNNFKHILYIAFKLTEGKDKIIFENNKFYTFFNNMFKKEKVHEMFKSNGFLHYTKDNHNFIYCKGSLDEAK